MPWSRLKPRTKYWFALPPPLCWVTTTPGTVSSSSPGRSSGRRARSSRPVTPSLAESAIPIMSEPRPVTSISSWTASAAPAGAAAAAGTSNVSDAQKLSQSASLPAGASTMWTALTSQKPGPGRASSIRPAASVRPETFAAPSGLRASTNALASGWPW